jgi:hypothetical protein
MGNKYNDDNDNDDVAETTLVKQADLRLCGSMNTGTISNRFF